MTWMTEKLHRHINQLAFFPTQRGYLRLEFGSRLWTHLTELLFGVAPVWSTEFSLVLANFDWMKSQRFDLQNTQDMMPSSKNVVIESTMPLLKDTDLLYFFSETNLKAATAFCCNKMAKRRRLKYLHRPEKNNNLKLSC